MVMRLVSLLLVLLSARAAVAQVVRDDFSDGDFTSNPEWFGDVDHFTVVSFEEGNALRSNGEARNDTLRLSTASHVAFGYWRFRFSHTVNLSNFNGSRIYLVSNSEDLKDHLQGYYIQFGTNNLNRVEIWRQDGLPTQRARLGESAAIMSGDANTVTVEVTRDEQARWTVSIDGEPVIANVFEARYTESTALGVWVKHNATGRDRFLWTDFLADPDPGDITPPYPLAAVSAENGAVVYLQFNEPLDSNTLTTAAFSVGAGIGHPNTVGLEDGGSLVRLGFDPVIPEGAYVLRVAGLADLAGNVQPGVDLGFSVIHDLTPPSLVGATAVTPTTIRVVFDEPVRGCDRMLYRIAPEVGHPSAIACEDLETYDLFLEQPLVGPGLFTVTATDVADLAGNRQPETGVTFFFGEFDVPGERDIVISEIMYAPADLPSNEYVEIYNRTADSVFDLSQLRFANATSPLRTITLAPSPLLPQSYAVFVRNAAAFEERFPGTGYFSVPGFPALLNSGDTPRIFRDDGLLLDAVPYRAAWGGSGSSLERKDPHAASHASGNWASSLHIAGGTPGGRNSVDEPDTRAPAPLGAVASNDGQSLAVSFDEPLAPASVTPGAFFLTGGPAIEHVSYGEEDDRFIATLYLRSAIQAGSYTLRIQGVADYVGNVTDVNMEFVFNPDLEPPVVLEVLPLDASNLTVRFDEPVDYVTASRAENFTISEGIGHPETAAVETGRPERVHLRLAAPLDGPHSYVLTVRDVEDLLGNRAPQQEVSFFFGTPVSPQPGDVVVNEIMFREAEGGSEYVELLNATDKVFDLSAFTLSNTGSPRPIGTHTLLLPPRAILAVARNLTVLSGQFGDDIRATQMSGLPTLRNTGDAVVLRFGNVTIDSVYYSPSWHRAELRDNRGVSLERLDASLPSTDAGNWTSSLHPRGGTPGQRNSVAIPPGEAPEMPGITVSPSPFDGHSGTVIRYRLAADAGSVRIRVFDAAGRHVRTLEQARLAGNNLAGEVIWNGRDSRGESLRVGVYLVMLDALDLASGRTESHRAAVVLARNF